MEQHPVPRNISGFQFHLIGDMTLRQFGYLVAGAALAFVVYKISPFPAIIKFPFAGIFAFAGVAFAFLPIQERPLDRWVVAFIKSIYSPTQYLWQKEGIALSILSLTVSHTKTLPQEQNLAHQDAREKLHHYLATLPQAPHQTLNTQEKNYIDKTMALFGSTSTFTKPNVVINPVQVKHNDSIPQPTVKSDSDAVKITPKPIPIATPMTVPAIPNQINNDYSQIQKQLADLASQKESLAGELAKLKSEIKKIEEPLIVKPEVGKEQKQPTIKTITPKEAVNEMGMPSLPQTPNIVIGVVKDTQKKVLPNIIITISDIKNNPIRALKTNKLGHFAIATALPNGTYLLETEDPLKRYTFDIAEITLSGKIFLPIEISAKGEKEMLREKLTKELFGSSI